MFAPVREELMRNRFSDTHDSLYAFDNCYRTLWACSAHHVTEACSLKNMSDKENERGEKDTLDLSQQMTERLVRNTCGEEESEMDRRLMERL